MTIIQILFGKRPAGVSTSVQVCPECLTVLIFFLF